MGLRKIKQAVVSIESMSTPGKVYAITLYEDGEKWCSCPAHKFKPALRPCKHIKAYKFLDEVLQELHPNKIRNHGFLSENQSSVEILVPSCRLGSADDESFILSLAQTL